MIFSRFDNIKQIKIILKEIVMFRIIEKKQLNDITFSLTVHAPLVAQNIMPGQFVMVMTDEDSERIPLTISDFDKDKGEVTIVFQAIGASTIKLSHKNLVKLEIIKPGTIYSTKNYGDIRVLEDLGRINKKHFVFLKKLASDVGNYEL